MTTGTDGVEAAQITAQETTSARPEPPSPRPLGPSQHATVAISRLRMAIRDVAPDIAARQAMALLRETRIKYGLACAHRDKRKELDELVAEIKAKTAGERGVQRYITACRSAAEAASEYLRQLHRPYIPSIDGLTTPAAMAAEVVLHHPAYTGWWYDEWRDLIVDPSDARITDRAGHDLCGLMDRQYGVSLKASEAHGILAAYIPVRCTRNPVKEYLRGLKWDNVGRIRHWLRDAFGVEDTPLHQEYARRWLIGAVARAMNPGCKFDTMLILVGGQGVKKSTGLGSLVFSPGLFGDSSLDFSDTKKVGEQLRGKWIYELSEATSLTRAKSGEVKHQLSIQVDEYRPAYARNTVAYPRRSVFAATSNDNLLFNDPTGNRRFWPVRTQKAKGAEWIKEHRDQLWAEAYTEWAAGEQYWFDQDTEWAELQEESASHFAVRDEVIEAVSEFASKHPNIWHSIDEIMNEIDPPNPRTGRGPLGLDRANNIRVQKALSIVGFERLTKGHPRPWRGPNDRRRSPRGTIYRHPGLPAEVIDFDPADDDATDSTNWSTK